MSLVGSVDNVARVLGGIGAASGGVTAVLAVLTFLRNRPKLKITHRLEWAAGGVLALMRVHVVNEGRQPIAVYSPEVQNFVHSTRWQIRAAEKVHLPRSLYRFLPATEERSRQS